MTEILTESFCERCGTRYTFESVAPRQRRLGGIRVLGKGLKNFVMSDDSSLDEAMAAARSDAERESTAQQLDAFHRTFNFCMSCRQYTCGNCWNPVEARCQSCAPMAVPEAPLEAASAVDIQRLLERTAPAGADAWPAAAHVHEELGQPSEAEAPFDESEAFDVAELMARLSATAPPAPAAQPSDAEATPQPAASSGAWAEPEAVDAAAANAAAIAGEAPAEAEVVAAEPVAAEPVAAEPEAVAAAEAVAAEAEALAEIEPEAAVTGLEPGASLEDAIAAYEASLHAGATPASPEPAEAPAEAPAAGRGIDVVEQPTWPAAGPVAESAPEPEPVAAAAEPELEPIAAAEPVVEPTPEPVAAAAPEAPVEPEPVTAAPEPEPAPEPVAAEPVAPPPAPIVPPPPAAPAGPPQWPTGPRWPTAIPAREPVPPPTIATPPVADPLAALMARQATEAMWAASSRDLVQAPLVSSAQQPVAAVQPCVSCGISLSANARFCRRCGTPQGS
ncbi:MAG TPA: hypothetical protein VFX65_09115 [Candidatus Limnocylindrales bacterium]|nr:hypothetical protein [Candidatus Limnocylindrales bacterium]